MSDLPKSGSQSFTVTASGTAARKFAVSGTLTLTFTPTEAQVDTTHPSGAGAAALGVRAAGEATVLLPATTPAGSARRAVATGLSGAYPCYFCDRPSGLVLISNGIDPMLRWDGRSPMAWPAGMEAPASAPALSVSSPSARAPLPGDIASAYYAAVRFVDDDGTVSDLSPIDGPVAAYYPTTWTYDDVPEPAGPRASRRQLLRTTGGQASVFYVDLEVATTGAGPFVSTNSDGLLATNEAVPLFDDTGGVVANAHGVPPSHKAVVVAHLGRLFAAAEVAYAEGHAAVVAGSTAVAGVGTAWPSSLAGRSFRTASGGGGAIASVDPVAQTLELERAYGAPTDPFAAYAIRPADAERKLVYYTPSGEPESWPATFALEVQEDGDEITGLMSLSSFLYILEREHIYRFTFKDDPAVDGVVFLSTRRGCLTGRLWAQAEDSAYLLDARGVHAFAGGESTPVSAPIQDLFRGDDGDDDGGPGGRLRINWAADPRYWHASWSGAQGVVRFFVSLAGSMYPRHALCYHPRLRRWWVEEYTRPITASMAARVLGRDRVLAGTDHREVVALESGEVDGPRDPAGTYDGLVTSSTPLSLTDDAASFPADAVNGPVWTVSGRGRGQWRRVVAATPTRLEVDRPWLVRPDTTTTYAVGGVGWRWTSGYYRYSDREPQSPRDVELLFTPSATGGLEIALYNDHDDTPLAWSAGRDGLVTVAEGDDAATVDLASPRGQATFRLSGHRERNVMAPTQVSVGLAGVQGAGPIVVHRVTVRGVVEGEG